MNDAQGLIGLCARAGRLVSGEAACMQAIRSAGARLVLLDERASQNTRKEFSNACAHYSVPLAIYSERPLGAVIGRPGRMVAAVTDQALAERIESRITTINTIDERGGAVRE